MTQKVFSPGVIINTICKAFLPHRGLERAPRGLAGSDLPEFDDDRIISDMERFHYVRIDALRKNPRGSRDWVVILVLRGDGKYSHHSPDLRKLFEGIEAERPAKEGRLDEVIIVAEEEFFSKKNLTEVVHSAAQKQPAGPDPAGTAPLYNAYAYYNFALVVPEHKSVPPHRIMPAEEVDELLRSEHISLNDLSTILTNDAPIVWNGGREGQVVEIIRDSQTAGTAIYYRRIVRASI